MSDPSSEDYPHWLKAFEELANRELGEGSSCEQVHPIVVRWFDQLMDGEPPVSRDSVMQAISCLATEVLFSSPDHLVNPLLDHAEEDDVALWIEQILLIGRAFEAALHSGDLDDL